jgi:hypothetical protein
MEDMYIVYMKIRKDINDRLYYLEYNYYTLKNEIDRINKILLE